MKLSIRFPKRGKPPADIPDYERDPGDPFVFHRIWKSCWFHGLLEKMHYCVLLGRWINQLDCESCKHRIAHGTESHSSAKGDSEQQS